MSWAYQLELRRSSFRYLAIIIAIVSFYLGSTSSFQQVSSWTDLERSAQAVSLFWAPFLAALGAWEGLRSSRKRMVEVEAVAARDRWAVRLPQYLAVLTLTLSAHAVALIALFIRANAIGLYGTPDASTLLRSFLMQVFALTVGFALADVIRSWLAVVLSIGVIIALEALEYVPPVLPALLPLNPMHTFSPVGLGVPNPQFFWGQCLLIAGLVALIWALIIFASRARFVAGAAGAAILGFGMAFLGGGLIVPTGGMDALVPDDSTQQWVTVDLPRSGGHLEVTGLYAPVAEELSAKWDRINTLLNKSDLRFDEIRQDTAPDYGDGALKKFYRLDLNPAAASIADDSAELAINDLSVCALGEPMGPGNWSAQGHLVFTAWLANDGRFGSNTFVNDPDARQALANLNAMSETDAENWVAAHSTNITDCAWDRSDFP